MLKLCMKKAKKLEREQKKLRNEEKRRKGDSEAKKLRTNRIQNRSIQNVC